MKIHSLFVYPIKSCAGISLQEMIIEKKGPQFDRRFMITDLSGRFLTQREYPQMGLIQTMISNLGVVAFKTPLQKNWRELSNPHSGVKKNMSVWKFSGEGIDQGDECAKHLSQFLNVDCRLLFMPEDQFRPAGQTSFDVSLADGYPFLLTTINSLNDLNKRLEKPIEMNRFRPNIVLEGEDPAWSEDTWQSIQLGEISFSVAKTCARCVVVNTNQESGARGKEPLATLSTFRRQGSGVIFGQNLIALQTGKISVGDTGRIALIS